MKYQGYCHCGKVQIDCEFELKQPTMCNCSCCAKRNAMLHIVDKVTVKEGKDELTCYRFNTMRGAHYFCKHCGIFVYSTPPVPVYPFAINLCILENCDWQKFPIHHFDGKPL